jgi:hypothetical protein
MAEVYGMPVNGHHRSAADQLLARLEEPSTAEALNQLLDHAELLAFGAVALDGFLRRGDQIAENMAAGVADLRSALAPGATPQGDQLAQLLGQLPRLATLSLQLAKLADNPELQTTLQTLGKPETVRALHSLVAFLPHLPRLVEAAPQLIDVAERVQPFVASPEFDALLKSGVFHSNTVNLLGQAGDAFVQSVDDSRRVKPLGPLGLLRSLWDADVQRTLSLFTVFAKRFGQLLRR